MTTSDQDPDQPDAPPPGAPPPGANPADPPERAPDQRGATPPGMNPADPPEPAPDQSGAPPSDAPPPGTHPDDPPEPAPASPGTTPPSAGPTDPPEPAPASPGAGSEEATTVEGQSTAVATGRAGRVLQRLSRLRRLPPRAQAVALVVAAAVLVVGSVVAARSLELTLADLRPAPLLVVALLLVPATVAVNVAELLALARLLAVDLGRREALRVVLVATAASFLPLPGAAVTRVAALTARGARLGTATGANLLAALLWVGVGTAVAAIAALALGAGVALPLGLVAAGALAVGLVGTRRLPGADAGAIGLLVGVEATTVLLHAARLGLVAAGLGEAMSVGQALVTGANGPLAAAAGVVPSGIGLAEGLGAALGATVALAPAAAFAATAANRVLGVIATAPLALLLGVDAFRTDADATAP